MANTTISPNMNLIVPVVGTDPGPDWANNINASLQIIDQHNHSSGSGVQITPAGLNISSDLSIQSNNLIAVRSLRLNSQASTLSLPADLGCIYESGVDLYYNDGSGNKIRLTQSGSVAGSAGSITGLPSGTASAVYSGGTFTFQSATNTSAVIDGQSIILRNNLANSKGLTLSPPNAMAANYTVTLPALPASATSIVTIDTSGNMAATINSNSITPTGVLLPFAGSSAPSGFLFCDGSAISRSTYAALFAVISTTYGAGDGSTTFNVPNTQGVFLRGAGSQVISSVTYSTTAGTVQGQLTKLPTNAWTTSDPGAHTHQYSSVSGTGTNAVPAQSATGAPGPLNIATGGSGAHTHTIGGGDAETRPANIGVNYIIKT